VAIRGVKKSTAVTPTTPTTPRTRKVYGKNATRGLPQNFVEDDDILSYDPTSSSNPPRPRTLAAGYNKDSRQLLVRFRDGTPWVYYDVPPEVWRNFQRVQSPGKFINRVLNNYPYERGSF
jgi:hypothetical protein